MRITSTTYCDEQGCPGHVESISAPTGTRFVLTDDPNLPLRMIPPDPTPTHTFRVVVTIQSRDKTNDPVEMTWYSGPSHVGALAALVNYAANLDDQSPNVPDLIRYDLLSVRLDVTKHDVTKVEPRTVVCIQVGHYGPHPETDDCMTAVPVGATGITTVYAAPTIDPEILDPTEIYGPEAGE